MNAPTEAVALRYALKPALVSQLLALPREQEIRACRNALPVHFAHRNDRGPQGAIARSITRSTVAHLRLLRAA